MSAYQETFRRSSMAEGNDEQTPSTIDNPAALDALRLVLRGGG